ncbi:thymidine phosphorylase [Haloferula helveola]|uniref:thymidine phosphorylase n=1 Tax=Haloferula helveola TaxID=490095 RepID=A0ABN6GYL1_9BACT|nr:thymidine phosphorylase [Haloferula helveola]
MKPHIPTLISRKRDGEHLKPEEIRGLIDGYVTGDVPDYQMSAFAMAVFFKGMNAAETAALTTSMLESGDRFTHTKGSPVVDKHSTGGIGDKVSLVLAPLVAAAGSRIPMVSGRGLGITGGTLDKLESIPGFNVHLSLPEAEKQLDEIGVVMMGQTEHFCPADKKLYALRDVTGTVPSIPLITASIMSKKLAESLDRLVLDVKFGSGAFMKTEKEASALAESMIAVGREMGVDVRALLNPMSEPLGRAVGNSFEVIEAIDCLDGGGPGDLRSLVLDLTEAIVDVPRSDLEKLLDSGIARAKFDELVAKQGGKPGDLGKLGELHEAPVIREMPAPDTGTIVTVDAGLVGQAALQLGAGRSRADDGVDHAVGFDRLVKCGESVHQGQALCRIHARNKVDFDLAEALLDQAIKVEP